MRYTRTAITCALLVLGCCETRASQYSSLVLSKNPVGYWRLGDAAGPTAVDETGNNNGNYVGGPTLGQPGLISTDSDTAVAFNGAGDIMNAGNDASLHFGGDMTITAWLNADTLPSSGISVIAGQWDNQISQDRFLFYVYPSGQLGTAIGNGSSGINGSTGTMAITPGQDHFLAMTYQAGSPGTTTVYVDGVVDPILTAQSPLPTTLHTSTVDFRVAGQVSAGGRYFDGILDEVAYFDRALMPGELVELFDAANVLAAPIPEPSTGFLFVLGGLAIVRHRRRWR